MDPLSSNIDLVNIDVYIKFDPNLFICFQSIVLKQNFDVN